RRWESVVSRRRGDVFFSLHLPAASGDGEGEQGEQGDKEGEPLYVSEVIAKSMNADFQCFDLAECGPAVTRLERVVIRVWGGGAAEWKLVVEADVCLAGLVHLGESLEDWRTPLPRNAVVWQLVDGVYTSFWDGGAEAPMEPAAATTEGMGERGNPAMTTSSYDALMKLNTLSDCIQDAVNTSAKLTAQTSDIIVLQSNALSLPRAVEQAAEHKSTVLKAVASERKRLETSKRKLQDLTSSLANRRAAMESGRETQQVGERYLDDNQTTLERSKIALSSTREAISAQQKRIVAILMEIYPIAPHPSGEALSFTIRSLHLPSTNHEDHDEATISAALGHVAHLVYLLSYYLGTPLRYPVKPMGSRSFVRDDISVIQGARTFPLWIKGAIYYRFEYAVFLINKDVQQLMSHVGLYCVDIRHTLANLKSLGLFVASGGVSGGPGAPAGRNISRSSTPVPQQPSPLRNGNGSASPSPPMPTPTPPSKPQGKEQLLAVRPTRPYSVFAGRGT
ncbi:UV radiation resistance protein and autophagy-related subunit 14-domain-containing protein, partial [Tricharina praecox]|uniref:UV radiation resistance protein and autophagy-related subunit 14-domain-containing protein n=1 Tax=Tricharina praecox TaxID=43433 RepID=UPI00221EC241